MEPNLLIFHILKSLSKLRRFGYKKVIQNNKFEYGVKIKNMGDVPFEGGIIKNVKLSPFNSNMDFEVISDKIYLIPPLNPGDRSLIWFDRISSPVSGAFWLNFNLEIKSKIISYQKGIYFSIKDEHLLQQEITNRLLVILTIIVIGLSIWRLFS